jgi:hypothetical protein
MEIGRKVGNIYGGIVGKGCESGWDWKKCNHNLYITLHTFGKFGGISVTTFTMSDMALAIS